MAMQVGQEDDDLNSQINTTPLVDVMLVLLIMLIITIPIQTHAVKLNMQIFFDAGSGWIAASSTCAVAARNLGLAFMAFSYGGMTRIRFEGFVSPASTRKPDPQRKSDDYNPRFLQEISWT